MKMLSPKLIFLFVLAMGTVGTLIAQPPPQETGRQEFTDQQGRPNLLQALGLSQDQVRQIRIMNRDRKPRMDAAQQKLREANRALDLAIYADEMNEDDIAAKLKEFQIAQADVARIRFNSELSLRKILTPDQLVRFRGLRERLANAARENMPNRRRNPLNARPLRRLRQVPGQIKNN
jgi:Spy/CpxP family protein refolding chaperone